VPTARCQGWGHPSPSLIAALHTHRGRPRGDDAAQLLSGTRAWRLHRRCSGLLQALWSGHKRRRLPGRHAQDADVHCTSHRDTPVLPLQDIVIRLYLTTFIKTLLIFMLITLNLFIVAVFYYR
jgi:hypothetical protein